MGKLEIHLLRNGVWETEYTTNKDTNFGTLSTDWTFFNMNILSQPNFGIKLVYSGINTPHADMCFSDIIITHRNFLETGKLVCIRKYNNTYSEINYSYNCIYPYFKWKI